MHETDDLLVMWGDPTAAVVAHGLLNSMAVLKGTATTLLEHLEVLADDPAMARELLTRIVKQASMATGVLEDLVRGLPPQVAAVLGQVDEVRPVVT